MLNTPRWRYSIKGDQVNELGGRATAVLTVGKYEERRGRGEMVHEGSWVCSLLSKQIIPSLAWNTISGFYLTECDQLDCMEKVIV